MYDVLGICLVVEKAGTVSLVLRYPSTPSTPFPPGDVSLSGRRPKDERANGDAGAGSGGAADAHVSSSSPDLFFTLPSRVMAKLFRPKPPLCGRPMTLSVGDTVFCCRAVLLEQQHGESGGGAATSNGNGIASNGGNGGSSVGGGGGGSASDKLVLFSVVVALFPTRDGEHSMQIDRVDCRGATDVSRIHRSSSPDYMTPSSSGPPEGVPKDGGVNTPRSLSPTKRSTSAERYPHGRKNTATALSVAVQRVHASLARLCRVLEREENRCGYVSLQSTMFLRIRDKLVGQKLKIGGTGAYRRQSSTGIQYSGGSSSSIGSSSTDNRRDIISPDERERLIDENRQATLELMLAACTSDSGDGGGCGGEKHGSRYLQNGNLARDLAATFHALSRNSTKSREYFPPTASSLLTGRGGIVYVNGHIAVPIEAVSKILCQSNASICSQSFSSSAPDSACDTNMGAVRPYHTLVFPHESPEELLLNLPSSLDASQSMQKLLSAASHFKSLSDIATEAALPVPLVLDIASDLVSCGACVAAPVISRATRFACADDGPSRLRDLALPFAQRFGPGLPIFAAVSALTSGGSSLGDILSAELSTRNYLGGRIARAVRSRCVGGEGRAMVGRGLEHAGNVATAAAATATVGVHEGGGRHKPRSSSGGDLSVPSPPRTWSQPDVSSGGGEEDLLKDELCSMAVWLRANRCIVEMKEYLVALNAPSGAAAVHEDSTALDDGDGITGHQPKEIPASSNGPSIASSAHGMSSSKKSFVAEGNHRFLCEEEILFEELSEAGCLEGNISTTALCWRFGMDYRKLRKLTDWGLREQTLEVVTRVPVGTDDWGAP